MPSKITPFRQLGIDLESGSDDKWLGDCPLCGDDRGRFCVYEETTQCGCLRCGFSGNLQTFVRSFYDLLQKPKSYDELAEHRGMDPTTLDRWGVMWNDRTDEYVIPVYRANLLRTVILFNLRHDSPKPMNLSGLSPWLFGVQFEKDTQTRCLITEGLWDTMKAQELVWSAGMQDAVRVVGVPGANSWQGEWNLSANGRITYLLYDNDHPKKHQNKSFIPSTKGMAKAGAALDGESRELHMLLWGPLGYDESLPSGYDVRDYAKDNADKPAKEILKGLIDKCVPYSAAKLEAVNSGQSAETVADDDTVSGIKPLPCDSFEEVVKAANDANLYTPQEWQDCFAFCFAVIFSTSLPGDQLWMRLKGPAGIGKTTMVEAFSVNKDHTYPRSHITGLNSGWKSGNKKESSASLVPKMNGKCLIWKDADTLINKSNLDEILAEFRDLYDRVVRAEYRHGVCNIHENLSNTVILCGTDVLNQLNRAFLGDRFFDIDLLKDSDKVRKEYHKQAGRNARDLLQNKEKSVTQKGPNMDRFYGMTSGYIEYLHKRYQEHPLPTLTDDVLDNQITPIAELLAYLRARKGDGRFDLDEYETRREMANRLISVFVKTGICLAAVLQKESVDDEVVRLLVKAFEDTGAGNRYRIVKEVAKEQLSVRQISRKLGLVEMTVRSLIDSMIDLGVLMSAGKGESGQLYDLTRNLKVLWKSVDKFGHLNEH